MENNNNYIPYLDKLRKELTPEEMQKLYRDMYRDSSI